MSYSTGSDELFRNKKGHLIKGVLALALGVSGCVTTSFAIADDDYDFGYSAKGQALAVPIQVFSGNGETFFQFEKAGAKPTITGVRSCERYPLVLKTRGALLVANGIFPKFVIRSESARFATVIHTADSASIMSDDDCAREAQAALEMKREQERLAADRRKAQAIADAAAQKEASEIAQRLELERALADTRQAVADLKAQVDAPPVVAAVTGSVMSLDGLPLVVMNGEPVAPVCQWHIQQDKPYKPQLMEWVTCAGYNNLQWNGSDELVPSFMADFDGSFLDALLQLKRATGWSITVHEDNKIIRITPN